MANRGRGRPRLNGSQQGPLLMAAFPSFKQVRRGNPFVWEGTVQPTELSANYRIRITYYHGKRPTVDVLEPALTPREPDGRVPHTFRPGRICLHLHEEWDSTMYIHQTLVPWISLWLYYYEIWQATGEWLGGGHEPGVEKTEDEEPHR